MVDNYVTDYTMRCSITTICSNIFALSHANFDHVLFQAVDNPIQDRRSNVYQWRKSKFYLSRFTFRIIYRRSLECLALFRNATCNRDSFYSLLQFYRVSHVSPSYVASARAPYVLNHSMRRRNTSRPTSFDQWQKDGVRSNEEIVRARYDRSAKIHRDKT